MPLDQYTAKGYYNPRSKNKKVLNQSNWKDMKFSTGCSSGASQIYKKSIYIYISYIYIQYIHETTHKSGLTMLPVMKSMKNMTSVVSKVEMLGDMGKNLGGTMAMIVFDLFLRDYCTASY